MKKLLALFDMDGTLFDTAEVNFLAYSRAAAQLGHVIDRERFMELFSGRNYRDFLPELGITDPGDMERIHELKKAAYPEMLSHTRVNRHLLAIAESIRDRYVTALVTTASRRNTLDILEHFGAAELFDFMLTQEDAARLKPDPECYLKAMEMAGISAENTVIFEDSENGIRAAEQTGAAVMRVHYF